VFSRRPRRRFFARNYKKGEPVGSPFSIPWIRVGPPHGGVCDDCCGDGGDVDRAMKPDWKKQTGRDRPQMSEPVETGDWLDVQKQKASVRQLVQKDLRCVSRYVS